MEVSVGWSRMKVAELGRSGEVEVGKKYFGVGKFLVSTRRKVIL